MTVILQIQLVPQLEAEDLTTIGSTERTHFQKSVEGTSHHFTATHFHSFTQHSAWLGSQTTFDVRGLFTLFAFSSPLNAWRARTPVELALDLQTLTHGLLRVAVSLYGSYMPLSQTSLEWHLDQMNSAKADRARGVQGLVFASFSLSWVKRIQDAAVPEIRRTPLLGKTI